VFTLGIPQTEGDWLLREAERYAHWSFDESMIPAPLVKGKESTMNRSKKDHGSQEVGG